MNKIPQNKGKSKINKDDRLTMNVPFFQVPNSIFDDEHDLKVWEIAVYCYLARCCNQGSVAFPSLETIGKKCGMSRRKAADAVNVLVDKGYLKRKTITGVGCEYEILYNSEPVQEVHGTSAGGARVTSAHGAPKKELPVKKNYEEVQPAAAPVNNSKTKQIITVYKDKLKSKGLLPVHNESKMIKQFNNSPLAAMDEKQVIAKLKGWFTTADDYTVKKGYPLGLFIKDYNSIEKAPRKRVGICDDCGKILYDDEEHVCKHTVICHSCNTAIKYTGHKRDEEILKQHVCNADHLNYSQG